MSGDIEYLIREMRKCMEGKTIEPITKEEIMGEIGEIQKAIENNTTDLSIEELTSLMNYWEERLET